MQAAGDLGPFGLFTNEAVASPVMVASHERSGTHFMMNAIGLNSAYRNTPWLNFDLDATGSRGNIWNAGGVRGLFNFLEQRHCSSIIKCHFAADFFVFPGGETVFSPQQKVIYIARQPAATLLSFQRYLWVQPVNEGPRKQDFGEFVRAPAEGLIRRYQLATTRNIAERWLNHVLGWHQLAARCDNVLFVSYARLDLEFDATMRRVLDFIGVEAPRVLHRPDPEKDTFRISSNGLEQPSRAAALTEIRAAIGSEKLDLALDLIA